MTATRTQTTADIPVNWTIPIGKIIKEWRHHRGYTMDELRQRAGVSKSYVSQLESGKIRNPKDEYIRKIAQALGVQSADLIYRRSPENDDTADQLPLSDLNLQYGRDTLGQHIERLLLEAKLKQYQQKMIGDTLVKHTQDLIEVLIKVQEEEKQEGVGNGKK